MHCIGGIVGALLTGVFNVKEISGADASMVTQLGAVVTRAMAKELGEHKIRVNMVAPGIMEDGISKTLVDSLMQEYVKHCGLKRVGKLSEIASIVAWFAQHNTYVTGQIILADGGL